MGSHSSKAAKGDALGQEQPAEAHAAAAASPSKANGQENGHVKINGDVSPKADGPAAPLSGNGSAEPVKAEPKAEAGGGDAIEPAPVAEGADAKAEGVAGPSKETPKKKKKFSFKKSFKLSGISFRKTKKEASEASAVSSPGDEPGKGEARGEENPACAVAETGPASETKEGAAEEKPVAPVDATPAVEAQEAEEAPREEGQGPEEGPGCEEEKQQPEEDRKPEETSKPEEAEPSPVVPGLPDAKEEE